MGYIRVNQRWSELMLNQIYLICYILLNVFLSIRDYKWS